MDTFAVICDYNLECQTTGGATMVCYSQNGMVIQNKQEHTNIYKIFPDSISCSNFTSEQKVLWKQGSWHKS